MPGGGALSSAERKCYYRAIKEIDSKSEYVICDETSDVLSYTGKVRVNEKICGRPTDEELTRALIVVNLILRYEYPADTLILEDEVEYSGRRITTKAFQNDIAILNDDRKTYRTLIEVKRITDYLGASDPLIYSQLFHPRETFSKYATVKELYYVSCDIPLVSGSFPLVCIGIDMEKIRSYEKWEAAGKPAYFIDILVHGTSAVRIENYQKALTREKKKKENRDLNSNFTVDTLRRSWRNIWDAIWGGTLESNKQFENFNKILLAKIYDERKTVPGAYYMFQRKMRAGEPQSDEELGNEIDLLYRKAYAEYLGKSGRVDLSEIKGIDFEEFPHKLVAKCVEELHGYAFASNRYKNVDILGEFYEMVIREGFKQTKGLFLTHPNLVLFILQALDTQTLVWNKLRKPDEDARYRLPFVIDPSCGTGTFLVYYMNFVQKYIDEHSAEIANGDIDIEEFIKREVQGENRFKWVKDYVFGMDVDPVLTMASQINQILHGDGSTNIYCANGLDDFAKYADLDVIGAHNILSTNIKVNDYYGKEAIEKFDIIISNPPFNVNVSKKELENRFLIKGKSEAYFLERWYQLLKPKGRLGAVLPESFFSVEDDSEGRLFLYKHFNIKFIVSLPNFTFLPHTNTSTSLLFAEKKSVAEEKAFAEQWEKKGTVYDEKLNRIVSAFSKMGDFSPKRMRGIYEKVQKQAQRELGENFLVFPYFADSFYEEAENYPILKKKVKAVLWNGKQRWILREVCTEIGEERVRFVNFAVENIGYKAGKKGAKDRPNELMTVLAQSGKQIYNLKYAHEWERVKADDLDTVLGMIRKEKLWE